MDAVTLDAELVPLLPWHEDYGLGLPDIDGQHKAIFKLMNQIWDKVCLREDIAAAARLLLELEYCAREHFLSEENFMQATGYPRYEQHKRAHDAFVSKLRTEQEAMASGDWISGRLIMFLRDWLISHVLMADREYAAHAGFIPPREWVDGELA